MPPFAGGGREPRMGPGTGALPEPVLGHAKRGHPDARAKGSDGGTRRERPARLTGWETEAMGVPQPLKESRGPLLAGPSWRHESQIGEPGRARAVPTGGPCCSWAGHPELPCLLSLHLIWVWGHFI